MKGFVFFIFIISVIAGIGSVVWWKVYNVTPQEQLEYIRYTFNNSTGGEATSNTVDSASKLGKVLKDRFNEAQNVYENGAEAKYE